MITLFIWQVNTLRLALQTGSGSMMLKKKLPLSIEKPTSKSCLAKHTCVGLIVDL